MTEKDVIIQDTRRELKRLQGENEELKASIEDKEYLLRLQRIWIDFLMGVKDDGAGT